MNTLNMMVETMMMNFRNRITGHNGHYRFYQLETFFQKMSEVGIAQVELWTGPMHFYIDSEGYEDVEKLLALQAKYHIKVIGLCPQQSNPCVYNIAAKANQTKILNYYKNVIEVAHQLSCPQVLLTSGWAYLDEDIERARQRAIAMVKQIAKLASTYQITLVIEALQPFESKIVNTIPQLQQFLKCVKEPNLKVCIDLGAMAKANETLEQYFEIFGSEIHHIHFVDGAPTGHLAWGDGKRNLQQDLACLDKYHYQGFLSLETTTLRYYETPWESEQKTLMTWDQV